MRRRRSSHSYARNTTQRPGNTRPQIVTEQIQRGGLAFSAFCAGPIQLLATEWAAKNPAEKSNIPAKISHSELNKVISKPNSITPVENTSLTTPIAGGHGSGFG